MTIKTSPIARVSRAYRHLERLTEVIVVLVKFGFGDLIDRLGLGDILLQARRLVGLDSIDKSLTRPKRLRLALQELGLIFIKMGQYLSTRPDLLPLEYIQELSFLQDSIPPLPLEQIQKIIAAELDESQLTSISETPVAAASVGQVHIAKLANGQEVVVKVKRPGLDKQSSTDLEILTILAEQIEKHLPFLAFLHPSELVSEFGRTLSSELNYRLEAANLEHFTRLYTNRHDIKIPILYKSLSTDNILVMEKIDGLKIDDLDLLRENGQDPARLARLAASVALEQIMYFGLFHADPHPGNLLVQPGPVIAFLDFGLVGHLNLKNREQLLNLAMGIVRHDPGPITRSILRLTSYDSEPDRERLEMEIGVFLETHLSGTLHELKIGRLLLDVMDLLSQHHLRMPQDMVLLIKALSQFESLGLKLAPDFNIIAIAGPMVLKLYRRRFSPSWWMKFLNRHTQNALYFLETLPHDLSPAYQTLKSGRFKADLTINNFDRLTEVVNQSSYRLSFAIVLASLIIGSSVVIHSNLPPHWHGLPVLGILGFIAAALVGFWLLIDFIRKKHTM